MSLDAQDYAALIAITKKQKPPLSLQYVVTYALQRFLKDAADPQLLLRLGDPMRTDA